MFNKTCYPNKSEKKGGTSLRLNLSKQEILPSDPQHTKVKEGISENVNDQQVLSTFISISDVQLKNESYGGDHRNNIMHGFEPRVDENCNQISLSSCLKSLRDSRSKEGGDFKEGLLSKRVLNPRGIKVSKMKHIEEKNTGSRKRPLKAKIKEAWIVNKPNEWKTMQFCQEKMSPGPEMKRYTTDSETLKGFIEPRNSKSYMIANVSPGLEAEAQGIVRKSEAHIVLKESLNGKMKMLQENEVCSVRVIDGKSLDFRCTICKQLPRMLNRSELYRHYATQHFNRELSDEFGHLKVCPYCDIELKGSVASHFGQKHLFVESYLPSKAWITKGWSITRQMTRKKIKVDESLRNEKSVWPKVPTGFDIDGPGNTRRCPDALSMVVTIVDGFEIEIEKEIVADQVQAGKRFTVDENEVIECRICKRVFEEGQATVMHFQVRHGISVSGDITSDITAFLTTGYITIKGRSSVLSYSGEVTTDSDHNARSRSQGVILDYESLLNDEL